MADENIKQVMQDAILDADSLERFINGSDSETVLTRLSAEYPTIKNAIKQMFENGGLPAAPFVTKALMEASALVDGDYAQVTDDAITDNNGLYVKEAGAWVKSSYDPIGLLNAYKDEVSYLVADSDDFNITGFANESGNFSGLLNYHRTDYIPILGGVDYIFHASTPAYSRHAWYDKNKDFISSFVNDVQGEVTAPDNAAYLVSSNHDNFANPYVKTKSATVNVKQVKDIVNNTKLDVSFDEVKNNGQTLTQTITQYQAELATAQGHENRNNYVSVAPAIGNLYSDSVSDELKKGLRGEVVYEPDTMMLHIPAQMYIMTGSGSYSTSATSIDLSTHLEASTVLRIYFDTVDRVFVPLGVTIVISEDLRAKYLLFATVRHSGSIINLMGNFDYRIGLGRGGEPIYNDRPSIIGRHSNIANTLNSVNFDTKNGLMQIPRNTIFKYGSYTWDTPEDIDIDLRSVGSASALRIYWNLLDNTFLVTAHIPDIPFAKRFTHVLLASVRNYSIEGAVRSERLEVDYTGYYTIDYKPYGIANSVTPMLLDDTFKGIAHRGYSTIAPENTLIAYTLAKRAGFTYVECDVSISKDDIPVLSHDDTIDARSDGTGLVADLTLAELRQYDYGSWKHERYTGTQIPTFEEFIKHCHKLGLHPYIELKGLPKMTETAVQNIIDIVRAAGMRGKVTYLSGYGQLKWVKAYDPDASLAIGTILTNAVVDQAVSLRTATNEVSVNMSAAGGLLDGTALDALAYAKSLGVGVTTSTINRRDQVLQLAELGIQGIMTDILNIRQILNDDAGV